MDTSDTLILITSSVLTAFTWFISLHTILGHILYPSRLQSLTIRILLMTPIYASTAFLRVLLSVLRESDKHPVLYVLSLVQGCYEAYVVVCFFRYLLAALGGEPRVLLTWRVLKTTKRPPPYCCLPPYQIKDVSQYRWLKRCILQFVAIRITCSCLILFSRFYTYINLDSTCSGHGRGSFFCYRSGDLTFRTIWPWLATTQTLSVLLAMYHLMLFYTLFKTHLDPIQPRLKFMALKGVIFLTLWQDFLISTFSSSLHWIHYYLLCYEMTFFSILHAITFRVPCGDSIDSHGQPLITSPYLASIEAPPDTGALYLADDPDNSTHHLLQVRTASPTIKESQYADQLQPDPTINVIPMVQCGNEASTKQLFTSPAISTAAIVAPQNNSSDSHTAASISSSSSSFKMVDLPNEEQADQDSPLSDENVDSFMQATDDEAMEQLYEAVRSCPPDQLPSNTPVARYSNVAFVKRLFMDALSSKHL